MNIMPITPETKRRIKYSDKQRVKSKPVKKEANKIGQTDAMPNMPDGWHSINM
jgi:hypothetical protein